MTLVSLCVTVSLGTVPSGDVLKGLQFTIASFGGRREYWWRGGGDTGSTGCEAGVRLLSCLVVVCSAVCYTVGVLWMFVAAGHAVVFGGCL